VIVDGVPATSAEKEIAVLSHKITVLESANGSRPDHPRAPSSGMKYAPPPVAIQTSKEKERAANARCAAALGSRIR